MSVSETSLKPLRHVLTEVWLKHILQNERVQVKRSSSVASAIEATSEKSSQGHSFSMDKDRTPPFYAISIARASIALTTHSLTANTFEQ